HRSPHSQEDRKSHSQRCAIHRPVARPYSGTWLVSFCVGCFEHTHHQQGHEPPCVTTRPRSTPKSRNGLLTISAPPRHYMSLYSLYITVGSGPTVHGRPAISPASPMRGVSTRCRSRSARARQLLGDEQPLHRHAHLAARPDLADGPDLAALGAFLPPPHLELFEQRSGPVIARVESSE